MERNSSEYLTHSMISVRHFTPFTPLQIGFNFCTEICMKRVPNRLKMFPLQEVVQIHLVFTYSKIHIKIEIRISCTKHESTNRSRGRSLKKKLPKNVMLSVSMGN